MMKSEEMSSSADEETPTVTLTNNSVSVAQQTSEYVRPILVGYAFGLKKMSTMGIIMAEASMELNRVMAESNEVRCVEQVEYNVPSSDTSVSTSDDQPIRVSFVPLDLNAPPEEQHGGDFDVILHKMTEDILATSCSIVQPRAKCDFHRSLDRIERLIAYKVSHPKCILLDHPDNILPLMSRQHMCNILSSCLVGVTTLSDVEVATPQYLIVKDQSCKPSLLQDMLQNAPFSYPIISKPLIAAGTVQSHQMLVLLSPNAVDRIRPPTLLQEYANHNSVLYKVYVLGETVWVFSRPSLPNLPIGYNVSSLDYEHSYVEFDSQQPYPDFSAFYHQSELDSRRINQKKSKLKHPNSSSFPNQIPLVTITSQEIQPVVSILRRSFGLDLFGFDVLVTSDKVLVVDVNYFPSYKEVSNFPSFLAHYLTQKAIEARRGESTMS